jgi:hypothetical protein
MLMLTRASSFGAPPETVTHQNSLSSPAVPGQRDGRPLQCRISVSPMSALVISDRSIRCPPSRHVRFAPKDGVIGLPAYG